MMERSLSSERPDSTVLVLLRISQEGKDAVLVLVNLDVNRPGH